MAEKIIIIAAQLLCYYDVCSLATTNILRLTAGNTLSVLSAKCVCESCGKRIPGYLQLAIISFIVCKGKCKNCGAKIPVYPLILEVVILVGMSCISAVCKWSYTGVIISYAFYEVVRAITVVLRGKRENQFAKQYIIAVISMIPFFLFGLFASSIYSISC